ncbi:hypothetical protein ACKWTF_015670 [Chironomus riparius]
MKKNSRQLSLDQTLKPIKYSRKVPIILLGLLLFIYVVLVTISSSDQYLIFNFKSLIDQKDNHTATELNHSSESIKLTGSSESLLKEAEVKFKKLFENLDEKSIVGAKTEPSSQTQSNVNTQPSTLSTSPKKCPKIIKPTDLNIIDIYWQVTSTSNGTFYLYNAYFDDRIALMGPPVVRILGFIDVLFPKVKTFCQFWYANVVEPVITEVYEYRYIWYLGWGENKKGATPYLISCLSPLPEAPKYVSIVEHKCDQANNLLEVKNKRPKIKEKFIVSVKKLDYIQDISMQIIEWCEIIKILGANKVEFSVLNVHNNVLDVLRFYEAEGFANVKLIKYPSSLPEKDNWHQRMQNELIAYHDTFYENLYSYDFVLPMDTDEFIIPLKPEDNNWADLLNRTAWKALEQHKFADSFQVDNHYFLLKTPFNNFTSIPGIPQNLYFLSNIFRAANFTPNGGNAKTFLRTDRVLTIHNHFPFSCIDNSNKNWCENFKVAREDGQLSHYRHECSTDECKDSLLHPVGDTTLYKYKDQIIIGMGEALRKLKIFTNGKINLNLG